MIRWRRALLIIAAFITMLLSTGLLATCRNPLRNVSLSGSANVTVSLIIPDYFNRVFPGTPDRGASTARIIDPATRTVDITVTAADMATVEQRFALDTSNAVYNGYWQLDCAVRNIPAGPDRRFTVETRDMAGNLLTSGSDTVSLLPDAVNALEIPLLPVDVRAFSRDETVEGSVEYGSIHYHSITLGDAGTYSVKLQSESDVDLYIFTAAGTIHSYDLWTPGAPTNEYTFLTVTEESTFIIGVFGNTPEQASEYTLFVTNTDATTPPVPGQNGSLSFSGVYSTALALSWGKATDDISRQEDLEYTVVRSSSANIGTVADAEANGTVVLDWTADTGTASVSGLLPDTSYYVNVLVRDEYGNKSAYVQKGATTVLIDEKDILLASDGDNGDYFGDSAAISGDGQTAVFGAIYDDDTAADSGAAYVFTKSGSSWIQTGKLKAADAGASTYFGRDVTVSTDGTTIAVGADHPAGNGAVYIFERGAGWQNGSSNQSAKLTASDGATGDRFGWSVSVSGNGDTAAVGAYGDDDNGNASGSVYIFEIGGGWSNGSGNQKARILPSDGSADDYFGYDVAVTPNGETVIAGAYFSFGEAADSGAVYLFEKSVGWQDLSLNQTAKLTHSDGDTSNHQLGYSVSISADGSEIAASRAWTGDGGGVYIFTVPGTAGGWGDFTTGTDFQTATLAPSDAEANNNFLNVSISADGSTVITGVQGDNVAANTDQGSACLYFKPGGGWADATEDVLLTGSEGAGNDFFGSAVSISSDGSAMMIGANQNGLLPGKAYVFE